MVTQINYTRGSNPRATQGYLAEGRLRLVQGTLPSEGRHPNDDLYQ